ncbi:MAG: tail fiber domain-containing protein [FCB group bacterium]|nr:tail fiber domain-containing protein [FCB group bacterium]
MLPFAFSRLTILVSFLLVIMVFTSTAVAEDTLLINYQGYLTDSGGDPITSEVPITFTIYSGSSSIDGLWSETHLSVDVNDGVFSVVLGSVAALPTSVFDGSNRWLGITVNSDSEISPRTLITSVAAAGVTTAIKGDIMTFPGIIQIHPPEPCVPPEPCQPLRLEIYPAATGDPADSCLPVIELVSTLDTSKFVLHPPDPCVPPDPCNPAVEISATATAHGIQINIPPPDDGTPPPDDSYPGIELNAEITGNTFKLMPPPDDSQPPPDDSQPVIELSSDAAANSIIINLPPPDDNIPALEMTSDTAGNSLIIKRPPPDDGMPPPDDGIPAIELKSVTAANSLAINQPPPDDGMPPPDDNLPGISLVTSEAVNSIGIRPPPDDSQPVIELTAEATANSIIVNGPPPDDNKPGLVMTTETAGNAIVINQPPPDDNMPGVTLATDASTSSMQIDWGVPPDDSKPAFEVASDADLEKISMHLSAPSLDGLPEMAFDVNIANMTSSINLLPPPDDNKPTIKVNVDALDNEAFLTLTNNSSAAAAPGVVLNTDVGNGSMAVGWFIPPPDDNVPPPDDSKPMAEFNMSASTATFEFHGEDDALGAQTFPIYMHSDGSGAKMGVGTTTLTEALCVIGNIALTGDVVAYTETRMKTNIAPIDNALEIVDGLNGVSYDWRKDKNTAGKNLSDRRQVGLLADDVEKVLPELVHEDADGNRLVAYSKLTAVLIEAVKELKAENSDLKKRIEALESK